MPLLNLPKNCFYYWFFGGFGIAYWIYSPNYKGYLFLFSNMSKMSYYLLLSVFAVLWLVALFLLF